MGQLYLYAYGILFFIKKENFRSSKWYCGWLTNSPIKGRGREEVVQSKGKIGWMWFVISTGQEKKFINLPAKL